MKKNNTTREIAKIVCNKDVKDLKDVFKVMAQKSHLLKSDLPLWRAIFKDKVARAFRVFK